MQLLKMNEKDGHGLNTRHINANIKNQQLGYNGLRERTSVEVTELRALTK